ncbi:hypothetical protein M758_12G129100 [Ceratodon purpureus]|uniref:Uncharacterized protein n=1 Tax=Ceratodon purpureus TaxID=3225 RepID=A0A8T0G764_CERPU|nr:hypothetical protein KC19_12G126600 [Ceratodon purpureus]KAG0599115.1 hypothetical protein M758_12G129100 [Ceratodon purpureus]
MSSESSLVTTAASDTSSSADSRYYSGGARRPNLDPTREATSIPLQWYSSIPVQSSPVAQSPRRKSHNLKARGVVIAKGVASPSGNQKVFCVCKSCKGQRMVSKSTCYRHLRVEKEIEEDDAKWDYARWGAHKNVTPSSHQEASRMYRLGDHLPSVPAGFH